MKGGIHALVSAQVIKQRLGADLRADERLRFAAWAPDFLGPVDDQFRDAVLLRHAAQGAGVEAIDELVYANWSPDGSKILATGADNMARLWDAATGRPIGQPMPHLAYILAMAFSPDSKLVVTGSMDRTAQLWDAATGEPLGPPLLHQGGAGGSHSARMEKRSPRDARTTWSGSGT